MAEGAEEVLLYGSVACGEATALSDLDLVALFADIDYGERYELTCCLEKAASEAIARRWPVQVFVTDRPEWKKRVEKVPSSFERRISDRWLVSVGVSACRGEVQWDKAMVRAISDREEALRLFAEEVLLSLDALQVATSAGAREESCSVLPEQREKARLRRMTRVCTAAALTVEVTLKALATLHYTPTLPGFSRFGAGHNVSACLDLLPPGKRAELVDCLEEWNIDLKVMSSWRVEGTYPDDLTISWTIADDLAVDYAAVAVAVTKKLVDDLRAVVEPGNKLFQEVVADWESVVAFIAGQDIRSGKPRSGNLGSDL